MDMIERVARAIFYKRTDLEQWHWPTDPPRKWRSPGGALYDSNPIPNGTADRTRDQARAAVEAMREPTQEMHDQARDWSAAKYGKPIGSDASAGCWRSMISGALPGPLGDDQS